jgi:NAD(P)-dependent dehydrogenase (short-subunit alcohol dehydrogenase family)
MNRKLEGKVAVVTGAGRGTGRAFALAMAQEGAKVAVLVSRHLDEAAAVVDEIRNAGGEAIALKCDVSKIKDVESMVEKTVEEFGKIDILVNNAGIYPIVPFLTCTEADYDRIMGVNLKGVYFCSQYVVRQMIEKGIKGKIVNIASTQGLIGTPIGNSAYSGSKGGVIALTRAFASELASYGIGVNSVALGMTRTAGLKDTGFETQLEESLAPLTPVKRLAEPEDYVGPVIWLASDEGSFATGSCFLVDGGFANVIMAPNA